MFFESFLQDIRIGFRVLLKERSFCALAVFVLALGICAVATQFAVVNGVLLRGFSFPAPDRLVDVQLVDPVNFSPANFNNQITTADFAEMRDQQKSFAGFSAYLNGSTVNLSYQGQPIRLQGAYISHDFFHTLGVSPSLGRDFTPADDRAGAAKTIILSDALWRTNFGADPGVLGRAVRVNGTSATIVGVMPPKFSFPTNEQLWIPVNAEFPVKARNDRSINTVAILARLRPDVTLGQANAEVDAIAKRFAAAYPATNKVFSAGWVRPLIGVFTGPQLAQMLYTMLGFCLSVLLIACINVMNMQFARATLRAKELAVRSSLGATRFRLVRQMLTENLVLATLGAVIGIAGANWATDYLQRTIESMPNPPPSWMRFTIDGPVLAFVVGATLVAALAAGLIPAWLSSRASAVDALKESGRGNTSRTITILTRGLVVLQILVTCVLLIGALLQVQSILRQQRVDYGYDTGAVMSARLGLFEGDYPDNAARKLFYDRLLRDLRAAPEIESAALSNRFRMVFSGSTFVEIEGQTYRTESDRPNTQFENVTPGYFDTLGLRRVEGRDFIDDDSDQKLPEAIVNAAFALKHFGRESALGRRFRTTARDGTNPGPWRTIVGVVRSTRMQGPFDLKSDGTGFFVPYYAAPFGPVAMEPQAQQFGTIVVRPRGHLPAASLAAAVRRVAARIDPNLPLYFVGTPHDNIDSFLGQNRIVAGMFTVFGLVAMILSAVGLYGVMSFAVNQRTQEFGIRMALGADSRRILRMVLRQGAWQIGLGLGLGLGLTLVLALVGREAIGNFLFEISPSDPLTYGFVGLLVIAVALLATFVPARRATKVDPMVALRAE
ncbi:MAG: ABC transporter permease [Opitutales bacterium]